MGIGPLGVRRQRTRWFLSKIDVVRLGEVPFSLRLLSERATSLPSREENQTSE